MATEAGLPNFWSMTNDGWWMINDGWSTINDQWWTDVCHRTGSGDRRCRITNTAWQYSTTSVKSNHILMEHILIQHGQVAALSRRGGQHKPICVSHWLLHTVTDQFPYSTKAWVGALDFILLASGVSWYQNCWPYFGSFRSQFIRTEVLVSALCSETKKTNLDYSIVAKRPSKESGRILVSKELYNKLPPLILLKRFTRFFEHAFQQWEPVEWWQLSSKSTRFGFLSK